jgi:hypothetical protein
METMEKLDNWWMADGHVGLLLVTGTAAISSSITGYCNGARDLDAGMAVINPDLEAFDAVGGLDEGDWWHGEDATEVLPCLLGRTDVGQKEQKPEV